MHIKAVKSFTKLVKLKNVRAALKLDEIRYNFIDIEIETPHYSQKLRLLDELRKNQQTKEVIGMTKKHVISLISDDKNSNPRCIEIEKHSTGM